MKEVLVLPTDNPEVVLRELATEADDAAYFEAVRFDPSHLSQFEDETAEKYQTIEAVRARRVKPGGAIRLGIWHEDTFAGFVRAVPNEQTEEIEIGYWVDKRHLGRGFAALAARALAQYVAPEYKHVVAEVVEGNVASVRSLEKAGFYWASRVDGKSELRAKRDIFIFDPKS